MSKMAKVRKLISVTETDIRKGVKGESKKCPIARALKRETGKVATVLDKRAYLRDPSKDSYEEGNEIKIELPRSCERFITKFDNEKVKKSSLSPFRFWAEYEE